ncbi:MAG: glutathione S-transferase family protein [Polyangiaceae bacterium]
MKIYAFDGSPTSRIVLLFCAEERIEFEKVDVDLLAGAHVSESYRRINPCALVPVLEDGDFRLSESSTILKYLADKIESKAYPRERMRRAKVHESMDWLNTSLYRVLGYNFVYPQLYAHHRREPEEVNQGTIRWGRERTEQCLQLLDGHWLGKNRFLLGDELTLADYFGAPIVAQLELIRANLARFENISRWMEEMRKLPSWEHVHAMHTQYAASLAERKFVTL